MKMSLKYFILLSALLLLFPMDIKPQKTTTADKDELLFNKYAEEIAPFTADSIEVILSETAQFFLKTPYVAHTLDKSKQEALVVNLQAFDCVTFVENVMALSFAVRDKNLSFDYFKEKLTEIRYRDSEITDYASRLHYTSDWIYENQKNDFIENISIQLSGVKDTRQIDFMSTHRSAYNQLIDNDAMLNKIVQIEQNMNNRGGPFYLPKGLIKEKANEIPQMAIVAFVTSIDGLDTTHIGFSYRRESGVLTFIHASSNKGEVVIEAKSLNDYCISQKKCKGVIVAKVL